MIPLTFYAKGGTKGLTRAKATEHVRISGGRDGGNGTQKCGMRVGEMWLPEIVAMVRCVVEGIKSPLSNIF